MTGKRYFKRMWEEEYYIFDSQTISENEFDEKVEYEDYQAFADSMMGDEVVNTLNEQHETIQRLKQNTDELLSVDIEEELLKENEQLKQQIKKLEAQLYCPYDSICINCNNKYLVQKEEYYISKCKKGHEQCSKVDVKYCDDFEVKELQE